MIRSLLILGVMFLSASAADVGVTLPPDYQAPIKTGVIRVWGHPFLAEVVERWRAAYQARRPAVRIEVRMTGSNVAMAGLYTGRADLALLGRAATASEIQAFEWVFQYRPSRTEILTGSFDMPGRSAALLVYVNAANPLTAITLSQIDSAFGHERLRGGKTSIDTWGQLGGDGEWQGRPITLYSFDTDAGTGRHFREAVLGGSRKLRWERLTEVKADPDQDNRPLAAANRRLLEKLSHDRRGLAVAAGGSGVAGVKAVALAECDTCAPVAATRETVAARRYPLVRSVFAYSHAPPTEPADPVLAELLAFILDDGQRLITDEDGYLPLPSP